MNMEQFVPRNQIFPYNRNLQNQMQHLNLRIWLNNDFFYHPQLPSHCWRLKIRLLMRTLYKDALYMHYYASAPTPNRADALSDAFLRRLTTSVAYIGPKSRTERPRKTKIGTGSPRHTWLGHHFQSQKVEGQFVADVLNSQYAWTGATWRITTKMLNLCRNSTATYWINAKILSACRGGGILCRHAHRLLLLLLLTDWSWGLQLFKQSNKLCKHSVLNPF